MADNAPFFIFGCGRSGTTLLRAMLNAHPRLAVPLESLFIVDYLQADDVERVKDLAASEYEIQEWGLRGVKSVVDGASTPRDVVASLHDAYAEKHGKERWGQKTPRLVRYADILRESFPNAKFIHVVRDPRGVVNSLINSDVHRSNALYASRRWVRDVTAGLQAEQKHGALRVRYEDLVEDAEETLRRVMSFLDESFDERMLRYYERPDEYSSYYDQIHSKLTEPPDPDRITAWEDELSSRDLHVVQDMCGDVGGDLGFDMSSQESTSQWYYAWLHGQRVFGLLGQIGQYVCRRPGYLWSFAKRKIRLRSPELLTDVNY
jgi:hypothetical protein